MAISYFSPRSINTKSMELSHSLPLVSWTNGIMIIGLFALVVVIIVAVVVNMMKGSSKE